VQAAKREGRVLAGLEPEHAERFLLLAKHDAMLAGDFRPGRFEGDLLLFSATEGQAEMHSPAAWTAHVAGGIRVHEIKCRHREMTQPSPIATVCHVLEEYLRVQRSQAKEF
jgi:thioesterase domain-containing protein